MVDGGYNSFGDSIIQIVANLLVILLPGARRQVVPGPHAAENPRNLAGADQLLSVFVQKAVRGDVSVKTCSGVPDS